MLLALDASTKSTGYAVFDNTTLITSGCITSASTDVLKRIFIMKDGIDAILQKYPQINKIVLEEVRPDSSSGNLHTQKMLTYLQAAIEFLIHEKYKKKVTIELIYPSSWRSKCGIHTGRGVKRETLKEADIRFVKENYNLIVNDDEADAICIGHACSHGGSETEDAINWG